jgi:hypothetical protein
MKAVHVERLGKIVQKIIDNPSCWIQSNYHCGSSHCIAGHAQIESGFPASHRFAHQDGLKWLGLTCEQATYLFHSKRTLNEIIEFYQDAKHTVEKSGAYPI